MKISASAEWKKWNVSGMKIKTPEIKEILEPKTLDFRCFFIVR
jgi:hypothetical protein